jgi:hypothetical protein
MDLLNKTIPVTKSEYEAESKSVIKNSWIQYRAEEFEPEAYDTGNPTAKTYHPKRRYYTDNRLIRTVTEIQTDEIVTCLHEHFDRKHVMGSGQLGSKTKNAERMLRYVTRLRHRRTATQVNQLKIEKIESGLPAPIRLIIDELKG